MSICSWRYILFIIFNIHHLQFTFLIWGLKTRMLHSPPYNLHCPQCTSLYNLTHWSIHIFFTSKYYIIAQLNDSYSNSNQQYLVAALGTPSTPKWSLYMHMYKYTFRFPQNLQKIASTLPTWLLHVPMWHLQDYSKSIGPLPGRWLSS
jgi:hypothetical protein